MFFLSHPILLSLKTAGMILVVLAPIALARLHYVT